MLLIVDDDRGRTKILLTYWKNIIGEFEYIWITDWPKDITSSIETNKITHISFDHDLGEGGDVSKELFTLIFNNHDRVKEAFKNVDVIVHSCNNVGADKIKNLLKCYVKSIKIIPLSSMH